MYDTYLRRGVISTEQNIIDYVRSTFSKYRQLHPETTQATSCAALWTRLHELACEAERLTIKQ